MKKPFTAYRTIRIDGEYDPKQTDSEKAVSEAVEQVVAEARSNALYNGENNGVTVTDVTDCGESL